MKFIHSYDRYSGKWTPEQDRELLPDEEGNYVIPQGYTDKQLPRPCWKPVFINGEWIETATEEEKNPPVSPPQESVEEKLVQMEKDVADLWYAAMMGGLA
jgi:hypothetical protein